MNKQRKKQWSHPLTRPHTESIINVSPPTIITLRYVPLFPATSLRSMNCWHTTSHSSGWEENSIMEMEAGDVCGGRRVAGEVGGGGRVPQGHEFS